jgi:hypothetical protein
MLPGITHRRHSPRLPIPSLPGVPLLQRNGHDHHTRAIAMASWSAGVIVGTAAGAIIFGGRHAAAGDAAPPEGE